MGDAKAHCRQIDFFPTILRQYSKNSDFIDNFPVFKQYLGIFMVSEGHQALSGNFSCQTNCPSELKSRAQLNGKTEPPGKSHMEIDSKWINQLSSNSSGLPSSPQSPHHSIVAAFDAINTINHTILQAKGQNPFYWSTFVVLEKRKILQNFTETFNLRMFHVSQEFSPCFAKCIFSRSFGRGGSGGRS